MSRSLVNLLIPRWLVRGEHRACRSVSSTTYRLPTRKRKAYPMLPYDKTPTAIKDRKARDFNDTELTADTRRRGPVRPDDVFRAYPKGVALASPALALEPSRVVKRSAVENMQTLKLSRHGARDSLFLDCLDRIRDTRRAVEVSSGFVDRKGSPVIEELEHKEKEIVHRILKRVDPANHVAPNLAYGDHYIDPYWNPFNAVESIKESIHKDFVDYARLNSVAKALKEKEKLRRHYRVAYGLCDPLRGIQDKSRCRTDTPLDPYYPQFKRGVPDRFWDPSTIRRQVLFNSNRPITWRDLHLLKFFVAETGAFLPRRMTMATRRQQVRVFRAIKQAQHLGVFPRGWKPLDTEQMRMEDPLQFLTDVLTIKYITTGCRRAKAMIRAVADRAPNIDVRRYMNYCSKLRHKHQRLKQQKQEEAQGNFSKVLRRYD